MSQSVEHDHPQSFDFLRTDIRNLKDFFSRSSNGQLKLLSLRRTWDFVVNERIAKEGQGQDSEEQLLDVLEDWLRNDPPSTDDDDGVFMSSFIPRSLAEVYDPERDVAALNAGNRDQLIYAGITGIGEPSKETEELSTKVKSVRFEDEEHDAEGDVAEEEDEPSEHVHKSRGFRHEDREAKKVRVS